MQMTSVSIDGARVANLERRFLMARECATAADALIALERLHAECALVGDARMSHERNDDMRGGGGRYGTWMFFQFRDVDEVGHRFTHVHRPNGAWSTVSRNKKYGRGFGDAGRTLLVRTDGHVDETGCKRAVGCLGVRS